MKVSVLIPTLGREKEVIDTVQALMKQTVLPDEIIVVDQNQPPLEKLNQYLAGVSAVKHVRSPIKGVAINYNRCLQEARGDIVLFVDDDVVPQGHLIEAHLDRYKKDVSGEIGGIAGRVLIEGQSGATSGIVGRYHKWSGDLSAHFDSQRSCDAQFAQGANMSFRRGALLRVGGFDLGFDGNGYFFETDGGLRLLGSGFKIVFEPRAELTHLLAPSGGARMKDKGRHTYYYVKNGLRLYRRHSPAIGVPFFALKMAAYSIAKAIYNLDPSIAYLGLKGVRDGLTQSMQILRNA